MLKNAIFNHILRKSLVGSSRFIHRQLVKMDRAYLRYLPDGEHFDISFELSDDRLKRTFNFSRNITESVEVFLTRVKANVDKAANKKKKKKDTSELSTAVNLMVDNQEVPKERTCEEVFRQGNSVQLLVNSKTFTVVINSPWVLTLNLPTSMLANFPVYPAKFETIFTNEDISEFVWYRSESKTEWTEVGRSFIYTPGISDIDKFLKFSCIPKNESSEGPVFEVISSCKVQASPGECPFDRRHLFTKDKLKGKDFRIVSYNILADLYCDSDYTREVLFPYCPPYALSIDYRKQLFLKEIIGYNADLICLQEVDRKVYKNDLNPALSHLGYKSTFELKGGEVAEGLAFFYNSDRFILLNSKKLLFSEEIQHNPVFGDIWNRIQQNSKLAERILERTTTLHLNVVGSLDNDKEVLVVANTHLYFHPDADHIRLLHGCLAIRYIEHFVNNTKERYQGKRVSVVFCGDFNSVPSCGIYQLYTTGFVPGNFIDYSSNKEETIENIDVRQTIRLASACGTPKYTNFTVGFADCLDYIFYEATNLAVSQVIPLPSDEELTANTAIPSVVFPSDHIALVSDLRWL